MTIARKEAYCTCCSASGFLNAWRDICSLFSTVRDLVACCSETAAVGNGNLPAASKAQNHQQRRARAPFKRVEQQCWGILQSNGRFGHLGIVGGPLKSPYLSALLRFPAMPCRTEAVQPPSSARRHQDKLTTPLSACCHGKHVQRLQACVRVHMHTGASCCLLQLE